LRCTNAQVWKKTPLKNGFSVSEVLDENGNVIGYALLDPNGNEIYFSTNFDDIITMYEREVDNGPTNEPIEPGI